MPTVHGAAFRMPVGENSVRPVAVPGGDGIAAAGAFAKNVPGTKQDSAVQLLRIDKHQDLGRIDDFPDFGSTAVTAEHMGPLRDESEPAAPSDAEPRGWAEKNALFGIAPELVGRQRPGG